MEFEEAVDAGVITKDILSDVDKKVISKDIEDIEFFLSEKYSKPVDYKGPINTTLKICHLWDTYFRLNYWGKKTPDSDIIIISSMFVKVNVEGDDYIVEHLNKNELRR